MNSISQQKRGDNESCHLFLFVKLLAGRYIEQRFEISAWSSYRVERVFAACTRRFAFERF